MYKVLRREKIVPNIHLLVIESDAIHQNAQAGEFVVVRADEKGERIPLNLVDWDEKSVSMVFMEIGTSTRKLAALNAGALFPVIRAYKEHGNTVITAIEARSAFLLYWQEKLKKYSDEFYEITRDGTQGLQGHVNDFANEYLRTNQVDLVYAQGCTYLTYLTSETTRHRGIKTIVGLNPIMVDATGMCGVCRVIVGGETKFGCVDGPEFDGHQVDWENLLSRRKIYLSEEVYSLSFFECETYG
jgi:NAD(P)H-flavin reductase